MAIRKIHNLFHLFIAVCMIGIGLMLLGQANADEGTFSWANVTVPRGMPFKPEDSHIAIQNPPDFSWPWVDRASYQFQIALNREFSEITVDLPGLENNYFNLRNPLSPGLYFWRVRPVFTDKLVGEWSEPRRFRIGPGALPVYSYDVDELMELVPQAHPRIWVNGDELGSFRERFLNSPWYDEEVNRARASMRKPIPLEPGFDFPANVTPNAEWIAAHRNLRAHGEGAANDLERVAFLYLITGDDEVGMHAVRMLLNLSKWDPRGATGYHTHDQVHRAIAFKSALAYDWLYDLMTYTERALVVDSISRRMQDMYEHLVVGQRQLRRQPYDSHGWTALGFMGIISLALLHDVPEATDWFREIIPTYINLYPLWGGEDGGWFQGNSYWRVSQYFSRLFADALESATGFSLYDKTYSYNSGYFPLYNLPHGSPRSHFGSENRTTPDRYHIDHTRRIAAHYGDPRILWIGEAIGKVPNLGIHDYLRGWPEMEPKVPAGLPPSRWYRDTGWVVMHSDLLDPQRISFYFKSSPIGSLNHSHADQNSFVLNAFGETLALDSGYSDWYHSPHNLNFANQTLAHNAITFNGGVGQPVNDITAKGRITAFAHHPSVDFASGDAAEAYPEPLRTADRHVIYLRPDTFILIDELGTSRGEPVKFEWRLHALDEISFDSKNKYSLIRKGEAQLKVSFVSNQDITFEQSDEFFAPDDHYEIGARRPYRPQGRFTHLPNQWHAVHRFPLSESQQIITILQPFHSSEEALPFEVVHEDSYTAITLSGDRRVWIAQNREEPVELNDTKFQGLALIQGQNWLALHNGQFLERDGKIQMESDFPVTIAYSADYLSISAATDVELNLLMPPVTKLEEATGLLGVPGEWHYANGMLKLKLEAGSYSFILNNSQSWPDNGVSRVSLDVTVGKLKKVLEAQSMAGGDGLVKAWAPLDIDPGLYHVDKKSSEVSLGSSSRQGDILYATDVRNLFIADLTEEWSLHLEPVQPRRAHLSRWTWDSNKPRAEFLLGAEDIDDSGPGMLGYLYDLDFLSGGTAISEWATLGQRIHWTAEPPFSGMAELILRLATVETDSMRILQVNNQFFKIWIPATGGGGSHNNDWQSYRLKEHVTINPGKNQITIWCIAGNVGLDYVKLRPLE